MKVLLLQNDLKCQALSYFLLKQFDSTFFKFSTKIVQLTRMKQKRKKGRNALEKLDKMSKIW